MRHCPNPRCPFLKAHKITAEYQDDILECSDCGTRLVDGYAERRKEQRAPVPTELWRRLAVTVFAPIVTLLGSRIPLLVRYQSTSPVSPQHLNDFNILSLGLGPVLAAFIFVEFWCWSAPRYRKLRVGGPIGRKKPFLPTMVLALVFAVTKSFWIDHYLLKNVGVIDPGFLHSMANILSLSTGTCLLVWITRIIDRWGLGNGFSVLLAFGVITDFFKTLPRIGETSDTVETSLFQIVALITVVVCTVCILEMRPRDKSLGKRPEIDLRIPSSGIMPPILFRVNTIARFYLYRFFFIFVLFRLLSLLRYPVGMHKINYLHRMPVNFFMF